MFEAPPDHLCAGVVENGDHVHFLLQDFDGQEVDDIDLMSNGKAFPLGAELSWGKIRPWPASPGDFSLYICKS